MRSRARLVLAVVAASALLGLGSVPGGLRHAAAEDGRDDTSIAASNGVVVHDVERGLLAARLREVDAKLAAGAAEDAARELADLASSDVAVLVEDAEGTYIAALEAIVQRVPTLPPQGLAAYRRLLDGRALAAIDALTKSGETAAIAREAARLVHTTDGIRLLVALADRRFARGDLDGAAHALEEALRFRRADDPAPGVPRVAVVSRLAAILAAQGDTAGVAALAAELTAAQLDGPPATKGHPAGSPVTTMREELAAAGALAAKRDATPAGPAGPLRLAAEALVASDSGVNITRRQLRGRSSITERPLPFTATDPSSGQPVPALLARTPLAGSGSRWRVSCVAKQESRLAALWVWPSASAEAAPGASFHGGFAPARIDDDLVVFPWPESVARGETPERQDLVLLSLAAEGKLLDRRGAEAPDRPDIDRELARLSFVGRPAVAGRSVFATLVGRSSSESATELHLARFDVVRDGDSARLKLRWRRHVLSGVPVRAASFAAHDNQDENTAIPSAPLVRAGRVFVASNSGAVACLDASSGGVDWIETYRRFGPSSRIVVREASPETWKDTALQVDGPWIYAAPRDATALLQFRRAPRNARGALVEGIELAGANGSGTSPSRVIQELVADDLLAVRGGVAYVSGAVAFSTTGGLSVQGSPLASIGFESRAACLAQIQERTASGAPCVVRDAIFFPTAKSLYRVPLADLERAGAAVWSTPAATSRAGTAEYLGDLVATDRHIWSVTPTRIVLLESAK